MAVPHQAIPRLMADLMAFAARDDVDPVTAAAVVHAQFETIHPFADGNGRIGRVVIGRMLAHRLGVAVPPPVSTAFARDVGGYQAGLTLFRQGHLDTWVSWFADAVAGAADRSTATLALVTDLLADWRSRLADLRADAAAVRLIDVVACHPVLSVTTAAAALSASEQASRLALAHLAAVGILTELGPVAPPAKGRPRRWFAATDLLALVAG